MVVDEVTAVAILILVVVGLGDGLVGEELVLGELEDEAESRSVEVLHTNVGELLEGLLVALGDHLGERDLVLHGGQPELRNTGRGLTLILLLLLGLLGLLLILLLVLLSGLDLIIGGLDTTVHDGGTALVQGSEFAKVLLLELQNLLLELSLQLGVLLLNALQAGHAAADGGRKRLDVARRAADELTKLTLDHVDQSRVAGEEGGGSGAVQGFCSKQRSGTRPRNEGVRGFSMTAVTYLP